MSERIFDRLPRFEPGSVSRMNRRVVAVDGLRGWAALSVVTFHFSWETFGTVVPAYRNVAMAGLLDGSLAVAIFFVLSGEALSTPYFSGSGWRGIVAVAVKRYPRLVIPILCGSIVTALLVAFDLCRNQAAGAIVDRPEWLGAFLTTPVGISEVLKFSFVDVFRKFLQDDNLMPFLWSMRIEMIGSVAIIAFILVFHRARFGWVAFAGAFLALAISYLGGIQTCGSLACFFVGMLLAALRANGVLLRAQNSRMIGVASLLLILGLLALDSILHANALYPWRTSSIAMLLVTAIACSASAEAFLRTPLSRFLGHISFSIFLIQFPVLVSFTSAMIVHAGRDGVQTYSAAIVFLSIVACVVAAVVFDPVMSMTKVVCDLVARAAPIGRWETRLARPKLPKAEIRYRDAR